MKEPDLIPANTQGNVSILEVILLDWEHNLQKNIAADVSVVIRLVM